MLQLNGPLLVLFSFSQAARSLWKPNHWKRKLFCFPKYEPKGNTSRFRLIVSQVQQTWRSAFNCHHLYFQTGKAWWDCVIVDDDTKRMNLWEELIDVCVPDVWQNTRVICTYVLSNENTGFKTESELQVCLFLLCNKWLQQRPHWQIHIPELAVL